VKSFFLLTIYFLTFNSYGQIVSCDNIYPVQGNGLSLEHYSGCRKKTECYFKNWLLDSTYTEWDENGKVKIKGKYVDGRKHGIWRYSGIMLDGSSARYNYMFSEYTYDHGVLKMAYDYLSSSDSLTPKDGETFIYYGKDTIQKDLGFWNNGQLNSESYQINGLIDSVSRAWDENGVLFQEKFYKKASAYKEIYYFPDFKSVIFFNSGSETTLKLYDNSGKLFYEEYYDKKGKVIKLKGTKKVRRNYTDFYSLLLYKPNSTLKSSYREYDNKTGEITYEEIYNAKGKPVSSKGIKRAF